uniref:Uncharacterized protein n=1 Tax=Siphoviridae sp. ctyvQ1 TaxID=2826525 RepID=A0A8S5QZJ5_9CAUD|nr:MAG TPA: hypothetical protein [Siphoviridae sp. ctyvQ1]
MSIIFCYRHNLKFNLQVCARMCMKGKHYDIW